MVYSLFAGDVTGLVIPDVLRSDATLNIGCLLSKPGGNAANVQVQLVTHIFQTVKRILTTKYKGSIEKTNACIPPKPPRTNGGKGNPGVLSRAIWKFSSLDIDRRMSS